MGSPQGQVRGERQGKGGQLREHMGEAGRGGSTPEADAAWASGTAGARCA